MTIKRQVVAASPRFNKLLTESFISNDSVKTAKNETSETTGTVKLLGHSTHSKTDSFTE